MSSEAKRKEQISPERKRDQERFEELFGKPEFKQELSQRWQKSVESIRGKSFENIEAARGEVIEEVCRTVGDELDAGLRDFLDELLSDPKVEEVLSRELKIK